MSIEGRVTVDALFHDKDGTASLKVVSLAVSDAVTAGKVAVVSGTIGTASINIPVSPTTYRDASGSLVSFSAVNLVAFSSTQRCFLSEASGALYAVSKPGAAVVSGTEQGGLDGFVISGVSSGTASYTLVMYGT